MLFHVVLRTTVGCVRTESPVSRTCLQAAAKILLSSRHALRIVAIIGFFSRRERGKREERGERRKWGRGESVSGVIVRESDDVGEIVRE